MLVNEAVLKCGLALIVSGVFLSCQDSEKNLIPSSDVAINDASETEPRELSQPFKEYWFSGKAELTSYQLQQERYGELRQGTAVTIFVTEDFLPDVQVKANAANDTNETVLKLNLTKDFVTGIYPYHIMTSVFSPLDRNGHAIKVTNSTQEWCGQTYTQLNNRKDYDVVSHSYFEGEADMEFSLEKTWLEDEIWSLIRIAPETLPTGELAMVPSIECVRLHHKDLQPYESFASFKQGDSLSTYTINYPTLQRQLTIWFHSAFPYEIEKWEEINASVGRDTTSLKTTAQRLKRIKSTYWGKNKNVDIALRDSLGLN
ncbi:MAG: septum formation inhibitor Maf [Flavobacteriaceae bacterium]|nr:septum formation inhibitor Maf [Flavobacteriaceae bacterium]